MTNDDIIKQKVNDFYVKQFSFTSVNIANSIKKNGTWIRNRDVAEWLRINFKDLNEDLGDSYLSKTIDVDYGRKQAFLYFPFFVDSDSYNDRNLKAMTLDEFKSMHGHTGNSINQTTKKKNKKINHVIISSRKIIENAKFRIRIPSVFIKAIGLCPGDLVSTKHDKIGLNLIPAGLRVHADYRVSIPRKNIIIDGKSVGQKPVFISLKDGKICFELSKK